LGGSASYFDAETGKEGAEEREELTQVLEGDRVFVDKEPELGGREPYGCHRTLVRDAGARWARE
jgi:hypothetical protein